MVVVHLYALGEEYCEWQGDQKIKTNRTVRLEAFAAQMFAAHYFEFINVAASNEMAVEQHHAEREALEAKQKDRN